jgi:cytochrome c
MRASPVLGYAGNPGSMELDMDRFKEGCLMRVWTVAALTVAAVAGLGYMHPFGNPRVEPAKGLGTLLHGAKMPADARAVVKTKIFQETKSGDMPRLQYVELTWNDATSSQTDAQTLSLFGKSAGGSEEAPPDDGDAARGKAVFEKRCTGCHALDADHKGPKLAGVYGRKAGSVAGFTYSNGLKNLGVTWNDATLEKWLTDPDVMVPENNMSFSVPKAEERRDLIAFLKH